MSKSTIDYCSNPIGYIIKTHDALRTKVCQVGQLQPIIEGVARTGEDGAIQDRLFSHRCAQDDGEFKMKSVLDERNELQRRDEIIDDITHGTLAIMYPQCRKQALKRFLMRRSLLGNATRHYATAVALSC